MRKKNTRLSQLTIYLKENDVASIRELSEKFEVSTMTIRRDLENLRSQNLVRYFHGGAAFNKDHISARQDKDSTNYIIRKQQAICKDEKIRIARAGASLINPEQTIMLDSGTTIYYLAQEIKKETSLTVICWSLNIIEVLTKNPKCTLLSSGGIYHHETQMFENLQGMSLIRNTRASLSFISAGGVHPELGVTSPFHYETECKKAALSSSTTSILLVDSTKFGKVCTSYVSEISDFDIVITDSSIDKESQNFIEDKGLQLIIV